MVAGVVEGRVQPVHCEVCSPVITVNIQLSHLHLVSHISSQLGPGLDLSSGWNFTISPSYYAFTLLADQPR